MTTKDTRALEVLRTLVDSNPAAALTRVFSEDLIDGHIALQFFCDQAWRVPCKDLLQCMSENPGKLNKWCEFIVSNGQANRASPQYTDQPLCWWLIDTIEEEVASNG